MKIKSITVLSQRGGDIFVKVVTDAYAAKEKDIDTCCQVVTKYVENEWVEVEEYQITVFPLSPSMTRIKII